MALSLLYNIVLLSLFSICQAQCPNTLAVYNPNIRTACTNSTYFIVPVDRDAVSKAVANYTLLPLPVSDKTLFPNGFPAGKHPVLASSGLESDIHMSALQLPDPLLQGSILVPYIDRLNDGETPFIFSVKNYVGGYNGDSLSALVPAIVGSLEGTTLFVASFVPDNAAYQSINSSPLEYIAQIKDVIIDNPVSGPGVIEEAVDTDFFTTSTPQYTSHTFHEFISQPIILTNTLCQRNPIYFNMTFTNPIFRVGNVTFYEPGGAFAGVYGSVTGYSASGNQVGYNAESCESAAANTDPKALA